MHPHKFSNAETKKAFWDILSQFVEVLPHEHLKGSVGVGGGLSGGQQNIEDMDGVLLTSQSDIVRWLGGVGVFGGLLTIKSPKSQPDH